MSGRGIGRNKVMPLPWTGYDLKVRMTYV
jgi:hypothetical protein